MYTVHTASNYDWKDEGDKWPIVIYLTVTVQVREYSFDYAPLPEKSGANQPFYYDRVSMETKNSSI